MIDLLIIIARIKSDEKLPGQTLDVFKCVSVKLISRMRLKVDID